MTVILALLDHRTSCDQNPFSTAANRAAARPKPSARKSRAATPIPVGTGALREVEGD
jgi:hypothetical protein